MAYAQCISSTQTPWLEVRKEMTDEKGLAPEAADKIGEYVKHKGRMNPSILGSSNSS
jgi:hypothetical protein